MYDIRYDVCTSSVISYIILCDWWFRSFACLIIISKNSKFFYLKKMFQYPFLLIFQLPPFSFPPLLQLLLWSVIFLDFTVLVLIYLLISSNLRKVILQWLDLIKIEQNLNLSYIQLIFILWSWLLFQIHQTRRNGPHPKCVEISQQKSMPSGWWVPTKHRRVNIIASWRATYPVKWQEAIRDITRNNAWWVWTVVHWVPGVLPVIVLPGEYAEIIRDDDDRIVILCGWWSQHQNQRLVPLSGWSIQIIDLSRVWLVVYPEETQATYKLGSDGFWYHYQSHRGS